MRDKLKFKPNVKFIELLSNKKRAKYDLARLIKKVVEQTNFTYLREYCGQLSYLIKFHNQLVHPSGIIERGKRNFQVHLHTIHIYGDEDSAYFEIGVADSYMLNIAKSYEELLKLAKDYEVFVNALLKKIAVPAESFEPIKYNVIAKLGNSKQLYEDLRMIDNNLSIEYISDGLLQIYLPSMNTIVCSGEKRKELVRSISFGLCYGSTIYNVIQHRNISAIEVSGEYESNRLDELIAHINSERVRNMFDTEDGNHRKENIKQYKYPFGKFEIESEAITSSGISAIITHTGENIELYKMLNDHYLVVDHETKQVYKVKNIVDAMVDLYKVTP